MDAELKENVRKLNELVNKNTDKNKEYDAHAYKGGENIIYFGAPGTGKSYGIAKYIRENGIQDYSDKKEFNNVFRVTLYADYSYSDFVGQIMPTIKKRDGENIVTYDYVPGIFVKALKEAIVNPRKPVFLVLEEMSRSNVAAIFGDIFQLLDRDHDGASEYSIRNDQIYKEIYPNGNTEESIRIPSNLFIIGTVNTSDQNVFAMDTAFKRRFSWRYVSTHISDLGTFQNNPQIKVRISNNNIYTTDWYNLYTKINSFIVDDLGLSEDKQIGPYFIKFEQNDPEQLIKENLLHYIWDDVLGVSFAISNGSTESLFDSDIKSFSQLYEKYDDSNIFSRAFLKKLKNYGNDELMDAQNDDNE